MFVEHLGEAYIHGAVRTSFADQRHRYPFHTCVMYLLIRVIKLLNDVRGAGPSDPKRNKTAQSADYFKISGINGPRAAFY